MNEKHRIFAEAYAASGSAKDAALRAGYSPGRAKQTGSELLRRPDVSALVAEFSEARATELEMDARALVDEAMWFVRAAQGGHIPASAGVRALDLVARLIGAFAPVRHETEERRLVVVMNVSGREDAA
jgi:hypothetical protein